jgi:creatinine amidohydrolase/Fe(II)-dependent formamide hydrolase-like protein
LLTGGILEEHGPYLPAYTDGYWNEKFADTLAQIISTEKN